MQPVFFEVAGLKVYGYGFMIAVGAVLALIYIAVQGKKDAGLTLDQLNTLFLMIFAAAFVGGKIFLFFEKPSYYMDHPGKLLAGRGFVFYGSFLLAIPAMRWVFWKYKLDLYKMLDVMAIGACIVHLFGRLGCFMAGCCYGKPTDSIFGVSYFDPACAAEPKGVPLHPTQLYESAFILLVMAVLLIVRRRRTFYGQLFLLYLISYAIGRSVLETFRGDEERGFLIEGVLTHSQFIALVVIAAAVYVYRRWSRKNIIVKT